jgi:hypothetical protein
MNNNICSIIFVRCRFIIMMISLFIMCSILQTIGIAQDSSWSGDTSLVSGCSVYFFVPTQTEYDSLLSSDPNIEEAYSDFFYYAGEVCGSVKKMGLKPYISASPLIAVKENGETKYLYKRRQFKEIFGLILINASKKPKIILGVDTDQGWLQEIKKYYYLK